MLPPPPYRKTKAPQGAFVRLLPAVDNSPEGKKLLKLDFAAGCLNGRLKLVGILLLEAFLKKGRSCVYEVLSLLETETERILNRLNNAYL